MVETPSSSALPAMREMVHLAQASRLLLRFLLLELGAILKTELPSRVAAKLASLSSQEDEDLGRRRLQQSGHLYNQGGWWRLRWREDGIDAEGKPVRRWSSPVIVGPAPGNANMKPLTKREAKRAAWERFLSRLDQNNWTPRSVSTVAQFVDRKFGPDHIDLLKRNTRIMYGTYIHEYS